jgi:hypothetical protein
MRIFAAGLVAMAAIGAGCLTLPTAARAQPRGSYAESCRNASASGGVLTARCLDARGRTHDTSLGYGNCRGDIANVNGVLSCPGGTAAPNSRGANNYYPQGSGDPRREPRGQGYGYPDSGGQGRDRGPSDNR